MFCRTIDFHCIQIVSINSNCLKSLSAPPFSGRTFCGKSKTENRAERSFRPQSFCCSLRFCETPVWELRDTVLPLAEIGKPLRTFTQFYTTAFSIHSLFSPENRDLVRQRFLKNPSIMTFLGLCLQSSRIQFYFSKAVSDSLYFMCTFF